MGGSKRHIDRHVQSSNTVATVAATISAARETRDEKRKDGGCCAILIYHWSSRRIGNRYFSGKKSFYYLAETQTPSRARKRPCPRASRIIILVLLLEQRDRVKSLESLELPRSSKRASPSIQPRNTAYIFSLLEPIAGRTYGTRVPQEPPAQPGTFSSTTSVFIPKAG